MTKLFFDFEFTGLHQNTTPISLGIIAENGNTFYAEFTDYDREQVDTWINDHVIKNLMDLGNSQEWTGKFYNNARIGAPKKTVMAALSVWLGQFKGKIQMWGDCLAYDWVLFCDLFGTALTLPANVSYIPMDICTLFAIHGIDPDISREEFTGMTAGPNNKHNALWDAKVIKLCHDRMIGTLIVCSQKTDVEDQYYKYPRVFEDAKHEMKHRLVDYIDEQGLLEFSMKGFQEPEFGPMRAGKRLNMTLHVFKFKNLPS